MKNKTQILKARIVAMLVLVVTLLSVVFSLTLSAWRASGVEEAPFIRLIDGIIDYDRTQLYDDSVIYQLPDTVNEDDDLSIIVKMEGVSLFDAYQKSDKSLSMLEFATSSEGQSIVSNIGVDTQRLIAALDESDLDYTAGKTYDTVLCGFEVIIKAGDFDKLSDIVGDDAELVVGEVYEESETQLVENTVNVYDTGIFNSSEFGYDGSGIVVAVLDTGLDYTHSAFSVDNFTSTTLGLTFDEVKSVIGESEAAKLYSGLTAEDVYVNNKVPFAFDYADSDPDVFPIKSEHGTHVSGIILGKDDTITGVAPNAQLASMKVFSDTREGARTSWILAALEDCIILEVDVINMSLGASCGFSRPVDRDTISGVYDRIKDAGISLIAAASNDYNSTYSSEKNGNLGLTSNPDSATVGSPSTYPSSFCVASISGVKTPYFLFGEEIIYFTEASDRFGEEKNFFEEYLGNSTEAVLEYVTIPGVGRAGDYTGIDVNGKIALVRRGSTTFEEKANTAQAKGAAGVIIYNNVSGDIKMSIGEATIPVCSVTQVTGEMLAAQGTGTLHIKTSQVSGPFMSDFSSWGPTPSLEIKPEITAHGGSILSAVPGQDYDRLSGTSMATPNVAGLSALLRQYIKDAFPEITDPSAITALSNQLFMSTADIVHNTNGLPYSVRKQGAGLANLANAAKTDAVILTYDRENGEVMDKSKIELGDDPAKTGVYVLKFSVKNFGTTSLTYNVSAHVMTEGVSEIKTHKGDTTVTEQGYMLSGASVSVSAITDGTKNGNEITVAAGTTATVEVTIKLSDTDKKYLNDSFANGMYVEGFVMLDAKDADVVDLSAPYLAFYGDWTKAPILDIDYFETNADEIDDAIDTLDKTLPDAYATRPIGSTYLDYITYLGSYSFSQNPSNKLIAADREHISLSNGSNAVNSLSNVWLGLLRNAAKVDIVITDQTTGEVIYTDTEEYARKAHGLGGIYGSNVEIDFKIEDHDLKNNTKYMVTLTAHLDYGDGGMANNLNNTFSFPFVTDFEAPALTGCEFYTEYDRAEKETRLFAKMAVYDNHYAMAMQVGYIEDDIVDGEKTYKLNTFDHYATPIYSVENGTTYVVYELTDCIDTIKEKASNKNTFTVITFDYALNEAYYEVALPDEFTDLYFEEENVTLNPYEIYDLNPLVYPNTEWPELLEYEIADTTVARVVGGKLIALKSGSTTVTAYDPQKPETKSTFNLTVRAEGDEGYMVYDKPIADNFALDGYYTEKAFYFMSSDERDLGESEENRQFDSALSLSMYPSEAVVLKYSLEAYFPESTEVIFESSNENIVKVDDEGRITAVAEGYGAVTLRVMLDGKSTYYSKNISVTVKDPFVNNGSFLMHYFGNGGVVTFPDNLIISDINDYAFSNCKYIEKEEGDEISEDEPYMTKPTYIGDDTITKVILPEGIKRIGSYAFAGLTALEEIVLPTTLKTIDVNAFEGCTSLRKVTGIENVKFINQKAFLNCDLEGDIELSSAVAIADYAFEGNKNLEKISFPEGMRSIGAGAFADCEKLEEVVIAADTVKLGIGAFSGCTSLTKMKINAAVIPMGLFENAINLTEVEIGKDVETISEYAFANTGVTKFTVEEGNAIYQASSDGKYLLNATADTVLLAAPTISEANLPASIKHIGNGAFSGNTKLLIVDAPGVVSIGDYAFGFCYKLSLFNFGELESIGTYSFASTAITELPDLTKINNIPDFAFYATPLKSIVIRDDMTIGRGAFMECSKLITVTIGDNVTIGDEAFGLSRDYNHAIFTDIVDGNQTVYYYEYVSPLTTLVIGENAHIGNAAFFGAAALKSVTLGAGATIDDYAFYNANQLESIDLSGAVYIGERAFSGDRQYLYSDPEMEEPALDGIYYRFREYAPNLKNVDLSSATYIGVSAFAFCDQLETVKLNATVTEIGEETFAACASLKSINLENVETVGKYAFYNTALENVDLSSATLIDEYAFAMSDAIETLVLSGEKGITIGKHAFEDCESLESITNLGNVVTVEDYAFANTALTEADLTSATYVGTAAFAKKAVADFEVKLGEGIVTIGDNPFAYCMLKPFSTVVQEEFNGKKYDKTVYTFDISDTVKAIDGSLYFKTVNGLELISYAGNAATAIVAEGTVRISEYAFAGSDIASVTLPYTLKAIGHKAFYDCNKLGFVYFLSYEAPILEEKYDIFYCMENTHVPGTGEYPIDVDDLGNPITVEGLGVVPYFMWNATYAISNVYYGANFVDYIGYNDTTLSMVYPNNGKHYDTFIYDQYFDVKVAGATAPLEQTLIAIEAINKIPDRVSLSDKPIVEAARLEYNKISSVDQQALVLDYDKLISAEKRIIDLENMSSGGTDTPGGDTPNDNNNATIMPAEDNTALVLAIVFGSILGVIVLAAGGYVLYRYVIKERLAKAKEKTETKAEAEVEAEAETEAEAEAEVCEEETEKSEETVNTESEEEQ